MGGLVAPSLKKEGGGGRAGQESSNARRLHLVSVNLN